MFKERQLSLWALVFAITDWLQFFRGAWEDAVIFTTSTLLVLAAGTVWLKADFDSRKVISDRWVQIALLAFGLTFIAVPRHSVIGLVLIIAAYPALVVLLWGSHRGPKGRASNRVKKARLIWVIWAVVTAIWEFAANILGQLDNNLYSFPTISVLLDPMLDSTFGKAGFVVVWILVGIGLVRVGRRSV